MNLADSFETIRNGLLNLDPVSFCEKNLYLDGAPLRLNGNGYKPFSDIYRYIGIKGLERNNSKPVVIVKGRQVGATTMASALELYFVASNLFGTAGRPPMRIMHCFPQLELVYAYTKTKLNPMITSAAVSKNSGKKVKSVIEEAIDNTVGANDSLTYKQFKNGNFIAIESTGINGDRIRGRTIDCMFFDECFPYDQYIETNCGKKRIGSIYDKFHKGQTIYVKTYNEDEDKFEIKKVLNAWRKPPKQLVKITLGNREIRCTDNHRFLTSDGWKKVSDMQIGEFIKTSPGPSLNVNLNGFAVLDKIETDNAEEVYDIEVEDNHNFIVTSSKNLGGPIAHNCQDMRKEALGNATKVLSKSQYGLINNGIQVYFGTPKQSGTEYWRMWNDSSQQYYFLRCENCHEYFSLYTPGSNDWEKIWIDDDLPAKHPSHGFLVRCTHCQHTQDKRPAAERGKWMALAEKKLGKEPKFIGFHINQLYMPTFRKWDIINQKPENHPVNTERTYQNEVLGEFFSGNSSPITAEELRMMCAEDDRKFTASIGINESRKVYAGFDWGQKVDGGTAGGQSYSCGVILTAEGPHILSIEFATKLKNNDPQTKRDIVEQMFRQYSVKLAVGDIGYANDLTWILQTEHGDRFLGSQAIGGSIKNHIKYSIDVFPKTIQFERDYYIAELYDMMKKGKIKFPFGDWEKIGWLVNHVCSMDIKVTQDRSGTLKQHYVKGSTPNDGMMALLNAYLAYKFDITNGFKIINPNNMIKDPNERSPIPAILGYMPRMNRSSS